MIEITSLSESDTMAVGRRLASLLQPGDVILLCGDLGCGKTRFAAGLAEGLGVSERVTSPSFVLVRRYEGFLPLVHADVYRLTSLAELEDLELVEQAADGVLLVEWGHAVRGGMPSDHLEIVFAVTGTTEREIRIQAAGNWAGRGLERLVS